MSATVAPSTNGEAAAGFHAADAPYTLANDEAEWQRLDDMHAGIKAYLGDKNTLAPLENPKAILELGAGSGIWAVDLAHQFPEAQVVAVDISQPNLKRFPSNCTFKDVNLVKEWPFEKDSFDVIHARFLLVHLPHFPAIVDKCIASLKSGGFLLLDDLDHHLYPEAGPIPSGVNTFYDRYHAHMAKSGVDAYTGPKLEGVLRDSGAFKEVHCFKCSPPMNADTEDEKLNRIGDVMRLSLTRAYSRLHGKMLDTGVTPEVVQNWVKDVHDPQYKLHVDLFFTWARKI